MAYASESKFTVRYAETDMMGIAHHSRYYVWFEAARTDFIKNAGISYGEMEKRGVMLPVTETQCKYIKSLTYEDEFVVKCYLVSLSVARCEFKYEVYKGNKLCAAGKTGHGFVDSASFRPINLKKTHPDMWDMLEKLVNDVQ